MLARVAWKGAAMAMTAFVFWGLNVNWTPVQAVQGTSQNNYSGVCTKIDATTYAYCCQIRLDAACSKLSPMRDLIRDGVAYPQTLRPKLVQSFDGIPDDGGGGGGNLAETGDGDVGRGLEAANNGGNPGNGGNTAGDGEGHGGDGENNGGNLGNEGVFSDVRLKRHVRFLRSLPNGLKIYAFQYHWNNQAHVGVMAQDLLSDQRFASAVQQGADGFYRVDYSALGLRMVTLDQWSAEGLGSIYTH